jgi:3-hydroxypropanoate dehydrogenase
MGKLNDEGLNLLFREARTYSTWLNKPVSDKTLQELYELTKWGPTSDKGSPARFVFLRSQRAKERLRPALAAGAHGRREKAAVSNMNTRTSPTSSPRPRPKLIGRYVCK